VKSIQQITILKKLKYSFGSIGIQIVKRIHAFPITTFYSDFDEFKFLKMGEDKADWED
jgi:hypothetical protein